MSGEGFSSDRELLPDLSGNPFALRSPLDRGRFVVIEGLDGAGTTTQTALLKDMLLDAGIEVYATFEPTSTGMFGGAIAQHVGRRITGNEYSMALAFSADRLDHLETEVIPNLHRNLWVLCDRYYLSTLAYQGARIGAPDVESVEEIDWPRIDEALSWLAELNKNAPKPDLTLFLRVPPDVCAERTRRTRPHRDRYDVGATPFIVDAVYERAIEFLIRTRGEMILPINGYNRKPEMIATDILNILRDTLARDSFASRKHPNGVDSGVSLPFDTDWGS